MTSSRCTSLKNVCLGLLLLAGSILAGGCVPVSLLAIDVVRDEREPRAYWQDNKAEMDMRFSIYRNKNFRHQCQRHDLECRGAADWRSTRPASH